MVFATLLLGVTLMRSSTAGKCAANEPKRVPLQIRSDSGLRSAGRNAAKTQTPSRVV